MPIKDVTIRFKANVDDLKRVETTFDKINKEAKEQEGILGKLKTQQKLLGEAIQKANSVEEIKKYNKELSKVEANIKSVENTGKKSFLNVEKSIIKMGGALVGAFAIKAVVGDAVNRILNFEKAMSSLSAITGVTGKELDGLKGKVLSVASNTKKSATEVAKAFELIGSKAPKLLENADALAAVTEKAIILSKATGEDLVASSGSLTGVLNQFNLESSESERIINALAAGSQKGAAPVGQISDAIDKFGTVANAANISVEQSIALTETLAEKNINGAEAGTQLRNIILKLQSANIGYTNGVFNLNDALQEVKDKNLSAADSAKLFGLESITAGNILVNNIDTIDKYTDAVTGTNTANEQAAIQTDNLRTKTEELDATYESFILSVEDGNGIISEASKDIVGVATNMLTFITNLNNGKGALASFNELIADQIQLTNGLGEQSKVLGVSQKDLALAYQNNSLVLESFGDKLKNGEITIEQYRKLVDRLANGVKEEADVTVESTAAIDENTTSTDNNTKSKEKQISQLEKIKKLQADAKKRIEEERGLVDDDVEDSLPSFEEMEEASKSYHDRELEEEREYQEQKRELKLEADEKLEEDLAEHQARMQALEDIRNSVALGTVMQLSDDMGGIFAGMLQNNEDLAKESSKQMVLTLLSAVEKVVLLSIAQTQALALASPESVATLGTAGIAKGLIMTAIIKGIFGAIKGQVTQNFRDGVIDLSGAGTETSDSIPARLSKGESVMTGKETREHKPLLMAIRQKKLDSYLMNEYLPTYYGKQFGKGSMPQIITLKDENQLKELRKLNKNGLKVRNTKQMNQGIIDALEEQSFLLRNTWQ